MGKETLLFPLCHHSLVICSSASQVLLLPAFSYFTVVHLVMLEPIRLSATSIRHTPFIIPICHFLFKGIDLSFWIPGLIYSSRNMYLSCITSTSCGSLISQAHWRISVGLPSEILNEAKLFPFHFLNSKYRIHLQQYTIYSVYFRISKCARDCPIEKYISCSQKHLRESRFWWEENSSTILRICWPRTDQGHFDNLLLVQLHSWRLISSSWYKTFGSRILKLLILLSILSSYGY